MRLFALFTPYLTRHKAMALTGRNEGRDGLGRSATRGGLALTCRYGLIRSMDADLH